eukprot:6909613-Pyramimonas_sp.AAC.1
MASERQVPRLALKGNTQSCSHRCFTPGPTCTVQSSTIQLHRRGGYTASEGLHVTTFFVLLRLFQIASL